MSAAPRAACPPAWQGEKHLYALTASAYKRRTPRARRGVRMIWGWVRELSVFISYRRDTDAARAVMLDGMISGTFNLQGDRLRVKIYRDTAERVGVAWPAEGR